MSRAYCQTCQTYPETLLSKPLLGLDENEEPVFPCLPIRLLNNGLATNLYADGTSGVTGEESDAAEEDASPVCAACKNEVTWQHARPDMAHVLTLLETMAKFWREGAAPLYKSATIMDDERTLREHVEQALADMREVSDQIAW